MGPASFLQRDFRIKPAHNRSDSIRLTDVKVEAARPGRSLRGGHGSSLLGPDRVGHGRRAGYLSSLPCSGLRRPSARVYRR
jgi:hypothetical protein